MPLFHPIVDIVNWQRLAAFARSRDSSYFKEGQWAAALKSFCAAYAVEVPLVGLFICLFGVVAGLTQASPTEGDAIRSFIQRMLTQDNSVATMILFFFFLLFGLFALAVSTLGSLFSAGLCAFRYDIAPMFWPENRSLTGAPSRNTGETFDLYRWARNWTYNFVGFPSRGTRLLKQPLPLRGCSAWCLG